MKKEKREHIVFLGILPPPYGGVSIKNSVLTRALKAHIDLEIINISLVKKGDIREMSRLICALMRRNNRLILALSVKWRRRMTSFLYRVNRTAMRRSIVFVMGNNINDPANVLKASKDYRQVFVELESMKDTLAKDGLNNVSVFPNCRHFNSISVKENTEGTLKLVFFSQISKEKGAFRVLDAYEELQRLGHKVDLDFWGPIDQEIIDCFLARINVLQQSGKGCTYQGVFDSECSDPCELLNNYDILILPTSYSNEGIPGVLIEAKGAAIPSIVSAASPACIVVEDGIDGLWLRDNTPQELSRCIIELDNDRAFLTRLKRGALVSTHYYEVDDYIDDIIKYVQY